MPLHRTHARRAPRALRRALTALAALTLPALALNACSDDEPPNKVPELLTSSIVVTCAPSDNADAGDVLVGGELQLIDDDPASVTVSVDGLDAIALAPTTAEPDADLPQTWTFSVDPERLIVCSEDLLLTFRVEDGHGEVVSLTRPAK